MATATTRRSYVVDLPGGTATTSVQIQNAGTLKAMTISLHSAAVGKLELSLAAASQIGTAAPTKDVLCRVNSSATAGDVLATIEVPSTKFKAFDNLYLHQTGTGNVGSATLII